MENTISIEKYQKKLIQEPENINDLVLVRPPSLSVPKIQLSGGFSKPTYLEFIEEMIFTVTMAGLIESFVRNHKYNSELYIRMYDYLRDPTKEEITLDLNNLGDHLINSKGVYIGPKRLDYTIIDAITFGNFYGSPCSRFCFAKKEENEKNNIEKRSIQINEVGLVYSLFHKSPNKSWHGEVQILGYARSFNGKIGILDEEIGKKGKFDKFKFNRYQDYLL